MSVRRRLRVLTWHVHGNYLYYLTQAPHDFLLVTDAARSPGHVGITESFPWGSNVSEVRVEQLSRTQFDCILFQSRAAWESQESLFTPAQRRLPRIYLEHDPPQEHPTNTRHFVDDRNALLVHVTPFNALMWDSGQTPVTVIDHGVVLPAGVRYTGELERGIVVVNNLVLRGRRLGADIFQSVRRRVPLDLVGIAAERAGGLGSIPNLELPGFVARYRFFFNPIRYTSLGLAVVEAMMLGAPVVGLATTELSAVIRDGVNGIVDTRVDRLVEEMNRLRREPERARELGLAGRAYAQHRFGIERFIADWNRALGDVTH